MPALECSCGFCAGSESVLERHMARCGHARIRPAGYAGQGGVPCMLQATIPTTRVPSSTTQRSSDPAPTTAAVFSATPLPFSGSSASSGPMFAAQQQPDCRTSVASASKAQPPYRYPTVHPCPSPRDRAVPKHSTPRLSPRDIVAHHSGYPSAGHASAYPARFPRAGSATIPSNREQQSALAPGFAWGGGRASPDEGPSAASHGASGSTTRITKTESSKVKSLTVAEQVRVINERSATPGASCPRFASTGRGFASPQAQTRTIPSGGSPWFASRAVAARPVSIQRGATPGGSVSIQQTSPVLAPRDIGEAFCGTRSVPVPPPRPFSVPRGAPFAAGSQPSSSSSASVKEKVVERRKEPTPMQRPPLGAPASSITGSQKTGVTGNFVSDKEPTMFRRMVSLDSELEEMLDPMELVSSSSNSPPLSRKFRSDDPRRNGTHRMSTGLVFNPGSSTVDCVQNSKTERRFSLGTDEVGKQKLVPVAADTRSRRLTNSASKLDITGLSDDEEDEADAGAPPTPEAGRAMLTTLAPGELVARLIVADTIGKAFYSFRTLLQRSTSALSGTVSRREFPYARIHRACGSLHWKANNVWSLLNARAEHEDYVGRPLRKTKAVVCGAGPCGIRAGLELALLGADVTVLDKRPAVEAFSRINRLHLWEWCKQDLVNWGGKIFDPPGGAFGGDNDFAHIGIGEIQLLLFKNALLLGVKFRFETEAKDVDEERRTLFCRDGTQLTCDALVVVTGANSPFCRGLGFRPVVAELRGKSSAIGVVANFKNKRDQREIALRQFSWARQFNVNLFKELEKVTSVNLENAVYYKAPAQHYVVMTPTKKCLLDLGVLREGGFAAGTLHRSNVDFQKLSMMVQRVGGFFGLPTELCESQGAMIFDFSSVQRLENPAMVVGKMFICVAGDALLEPFWPEGLGIIRGFMSVLDAVSAIVLHARGESNAAVAQTTTTFNVLKSVAAQTAGQCLQKDSKSYRLDPRSRYILS